MFYWIIAYVNFEKKTPCDEFYFVFVCPHFEDIRNRLSKSITGKKPKVFKFLQLLSIHNIHDLYNLRRYVYFAFKSREVILS